MASAKFLFSGPDISLTTFSSLLTICSGGLAGSLIAAGGIDGKPPTEGFLGAGVSVTEAPEPSVGVVTSLGGVGADDNCSCVLKS